MPNFTPKTSRDATELLFKLREAGYNAVPSQKDKKLPVLKDGRWKVWREGVDEDRLQHWKQKSHYGVCILTDDLIVIDADSAELVELLYNLEAKYDCEPALVGFTPKGEHHYFRRGDIDCQNIGGKSLDLRTNGGQVFCYEAGDPEQRFLEKYDLSINELTVPPVEFIDEIFTMQDLRRKVKSSEKNGEREDRDFNTPSLELVELELAVNFIPPDVGYSEWPPVQFTGCTGSSYGPVGNPCSTWFAEP